MLDRMTQWVLTLFAVAMLPAAAALGAALHEGRLQQETPDLTCEVVEALLRSTPMENSTLGRRVSRYSQDLNPDAPRIAYRNYPVVVVESLKYPSRGIARQAAQGGWTPAAGHSSPSTIDELVSRWPYHSRGYLWRAAGEAQLADLSGCGLPLKTEFYTSDPIAVRGSALNYVSVELDRGKYALTWTSETEQCSSSATHYYIGRIVSEPGGKSAIIEYRKCGDRKRLYGSDRSYREASVDRAVKRNGEWEFYPVKFND